MQKASDVNINKSSNINCYFLEHSFVNPKILAELSVQAKNKFLFQPYDGVLLTTCQRIELYSNIPINDPFIDVFGFKSQYVYGCFDVYRRLVQIGCGLRSQILGETFIYTQLKNTIY
jgi:glutamyl-tRNA reductase